MSEEENVEALQELEEVVPPEENTSNDLPSEEQASRESDQEYNWRQLREAKRLLEEENRELRERYQREEAPPSPKKEDDFDIPDDELVEGRHVKRLLSKVQSMLQQQEERSVPDRLRARYPDFDSVVSAQNVERLKQEEPELLASIIATPDVYAKGAAAYKLLKRIGTPASKSNDREVAERNRSRPGSSNAAARQSPLSDADRFANGLTPELRKQLLKEMEDAARAS